MRPPANEVFVKVKEGNTPKTSPISPNTYSLISKEYRGKGIARIYRYGVIYRMAAPPRYRRLKRRFRRSTRPSVSMMRCSPVKNGWH